MREKNPCSDWMIQVILNESLRKETKSVSQLKNPILYFYEEMHPKGHLKGPQRSRLQLYFHKKTILAQKCLGKALNNPNFMPKSTGVNAKHLLLLFSHTPRKTTTTERSLFEVTKYLPWTCFLKVPETFWTLKAIFNSSVYKNREV